MLRSRSGVHVQAIPGLYMDASASCLASRQQARAYVAPALRCLYGSGAPLEAWKAPGWRDVAMHLPGQTARDFPHPALERR